VHAYAQNAVTRIADTLKAQGLVVPDSEAVRAIFIPLGIAVFAIAVGVIKILIGVSRDKPVGFLIALCVVSFIFALFAFGRRPLRSVYGDMVLASLKRQHMGSPYIGSRAADFSSAEFASMMGLFGMAALTGPEWTDFRQCLRPAGSADGSASGCGSSCGSSCGGGGCGGGCGGCGGG
jgi:uncharacterized protein (TIGR04222 family)